MYALLAMIFKSSVSVLSIWRNEHDKDNTCLWYTSILPSNVGFRYWITSSGGTSSVCLKSLCSFRVRSFAHTKSSTIFAILSVVFEDSKFCRTSYSPWSRRRMFSPESEDGATFETISPEEVGIVGWEMGRWDRVCKSIVGVDSWRLSVDGVVTPSCNQSSSHLIEEKQLIHEHLFRRWRTRYMFGMVTGSHTQCWSCRDWRWVQIVFGSFGVSISWTSVLSHGWIHPVSKGVSLKDRLITHRLDELMISQRMIPWAFRWC